MNQEILKAINDLNKRINDIEYKMEKYLLGKHEESKEAITDTDMAVMELAEIIGDMQNEEEETDNG